MPSPPRYSPHTSRLSRGSLVATLLALIVVLSGCVAVQLKAVVHSDGTLSGTARLGVSKSLASLGGSDPADVVRQIRQGNPCDFGGKSGTAKDFDDGTYVGVDCSFDGVTMAQFNQSARGPQLSRSGDEFRLTGTFDLTDALSTGGGLSPSSGASTAPSALPSGLPSGFPTDLSSLLPSGFPTDLSSLLPSGFPTDLSGLLPSGFPTDLSSLLPSGLPSNLSSLLPSGLPTSLPSLDPSQLLKTAKVSFQFTFPGKVESTKGSAQGNTVTFTPDKNGNINFETVASAKPSSSSGLKPALWVIFVAVLLAIAGLIGWLLWRRRRGQAAGGGTGPGAGHPQPGYPAAGYPPSGYPQTGYPQTGYPQTGYPQTQNYPPPEQYPQGQPYPPAQQYPPTQQYPPAQQQDREPTEHYPPAEPPPEYQPPEYQPPEYQPPPSYPPPAYRRDPEPPA